MIKLEGNEKKIKKSNEKSEDKQKQLNQRIKKIMRQNEEDDLLFQASISKIEMVQSHYKSVDRELNDLLEEKRNIIREIRIKQSEFEEEMQREIDKMVKEDKKDKKSAEEELSDIKNKDKRGED